MVYVFDFMTRSGEIDHFDIVYCRDDLDARKSAGLALKANARATRIVVWDDDRSFVVEHGALEEVLVETNARQVL